MPTAVKTTLTELPDSRVRLRVEVPAAEVEQRLERKASQLGRQLKLPGFRRGKVPPPLVLSRIGREAVLEEAVRETLPSWYTAAIESAAIVPVGDPQIDLGKLPGEGQALEFSIEIGVLPKAELGQYAGLEVPRREPAVSEEQIDDEVARLRDQLARLETVQRPAAVGDFVVLDYELEPPSGSEQGPGEPKRRRKRRPAPAGADGRDQLVELGAGNLIPGFEEGLLGASAGEERTVTVTFPADHPSEELAGREASLAVKVKEVKAKQLPELDEDFAADAGFDSVEELREQVRERLLEGEQATVEAEFRQAALDAAVAGAKVIVTPELADARAQEMWERMLRSLAGRGVSREAYLKLSGREEKDLLAELRPDAELGLRREAVITAIVAAEGIEPSEEELLAALEPLAEREGAEPRRLLEQLRSAGRLDEVREDLAARQAVELIASRAVPITPAQAKARGQLWTPEQERAPGEGAIASPGGLWTPDR